jgi:hypothetical protein
MIWFFERESARLHYEIRQRADGQDFEIVVTYPDGSQLVEQYSDAGQLIDRSTAIRSELFAHGWRALGDPSRGASARSLE